MEAKTGDRVSLDAKKVGQPRRTGTISNVSKGLSGVRYQVRWDDGSQTTLSPGPGILTIEGRGKANSKGPSNSKSKRSVATKRSKPARKKR